MGKLKTVGYELRDIAVMQAPVSFANHRGDVDPFIEVCNRKVYPIFVAPMASVTDYKNYNIWIDNKLTPIIPRSVQDDLNFEQRMLLSDRTFVSISLKEAQWDLPKYLENIVNQDSSSDTSLTYIGPFYICIDIAHGTLSELYEACRNLKDKYEKRVIIMAGNVANPSAYQFYADAGIDWMRAGIGGGSRCTSSANVSIHYPMATLLDQLNEERKAYAHSHNGNAPTKIIADGGIGWFDDIQKSLALGADAVMCGKIFAECEEACGPIYFSKDIESECKQCEGIRIYDSVDLDRGMIPHTWKRFRDYYGMSTKRAQKQIGGNGCKTSEGIDRPVEVKYPVAKWIDNMQSYLRSCMTYTNSHTIKELRENSQVIILGGSGDAAYRK